MLTKEQIIEAVQGMESLEEVEAIKSECELRSMALQEEADDDDFDDDDGEF